MPRESISLARFEEKVAEKARFTVIHGRVYDLSQEFLQWHPGGDVAATQIGQDGTTAFDAFHDLTTQELLANFYVCDMDSQELKDGGINQFALDILKIHHLITKSGWWHDSRLYYCWKFASTLSLALVSLSMLHQYGHRNFIFFLASCFMALFFQQTGWLSHDFLHNQVFTQKKHNYALGFITSCIWQGLSPNWWLNKHNTHHAVPNVHMADPDIDTMPFLAWYEDALELSSDSNIVKFWIPHQPILLFPLLSFVRLSWTLGSIAYQIYGNVNISTVLLETLGLVIHYSWQFGLPLLWLSTPRALLYISASQSIGSILLALVFILNHNGRATMKKDTLQTKDFYKLQILTSRNIQPTLLLDWIMGGLNYQIEHHLFPTLPRHNYHLVAPLVQAVCAKHGVHYHKTTFRQGMMEILESLRKVGNLVGKEAAFTTST